MDCAPANPSPVCLPQLTSYRSGLISRPPNSILVVHTMAPCSATTYRIEFKAANRRGGDRQFGHAPNGTQATQVFGPSSFPAGRPAQITFTSNSRRGSWEGESRSVATCTAGRAGSPVAYASNPARYLEYRLLVGNLGLQVADWLPWSYTRVSIDLRYIGTLSGLPQEVIVTIPTPFVPMEAW